MCCMAKLTHTTLFWQYSVLQCTSILFHYRKKLRVKVFADILQNLKQPFVYVHLRVDTHMRMSSS
jgi:hypothetical protein